MAMAIRHLHADFPGRPWFQFSNGALFVPPHPTESAWRLRLPHDESYGRPGAPW